MRRRTLVAVLLTACRPEPEPAPAPSLAAEAVARPEPSSPGPDEPAEPEALRPISTPEIRAAREAAQRRVLGADALLLADLEPMGAPARGRFSPLIHPPDVDALAHFHAALAGLRAGTHDKLRVAVFGASGTAADIWTAYLRTYLQVRFGDGGPGFVSPIRHRSWSRHSEYTIESSKRWTRHQTGTRTASPGGYYGLAGVAMAAGRPGATGRIEPRGPSSRGVDTFELLYLVQPNGGRVAVQIDDARPQVVDTRGREFGPGYRRFALEPGPHRLALKTLDRREVRVFGVVAERPDRGVVLDTLGVDGAGAGLHLGGDEALWADHLRHRAPDLVLLAYGTNEAFDADFDAGRFAANLRGLLARLARAAPQASCVLMAPGDHDRPDGDPELAPRLAAVRRIEREVAAASGCALWDALDFMGGAGAMDAWVHADPPLARPDYVHTTSRGAVLTATAVADALLLRYDAGLAPAPP